ncbi:glutathione S-transferase [Mariannaea sp. PMI_226]|nr:glutathione S-transferase [Mariannaea sp. PMI_226]
MASQESPVVFHYFNLGRLGRGEVVRLFMKDAGIDYEDVLYSYDETWPTTNDKLGLTSTGKLPALEYKGNFLTQHLPILRYLARDLGRYDGETNDEKFFVDAVSDVYIDWRFQWVLQLSERTDKYKDVTVPKYLEVLEEHYSKNNGPYLLGDRITYADFAVYQSIDNDTRIGTIPAELPASIQKFKEAFEARPNIAAYIKEHAHK